MATRSGSSFAHHVLKTARSVLDRLDVREKDGFHLLTMNASLDRDGEGSTLESAPPPYGPETPLGDDAPEAVFSADSRGERLADGCLHGVGVTAGVVAFAVLMAVALPQGNALLNVSVMLYGGGLLAMLGCSALYNMTVPSPRKELLRRFDHAAIFLLIAGTYTPFSLVKIGGAWGLGLFGLVWLGAAAGVAVKLLYPRRFERLAIAAYLLLGWSILGALGPLLSAVSLPVAILLAIGGFLYSFGLVFHLWKRLPYHNAIWHALVLAAAGCHYAAVLGSVAFAGGPS